MVRLKKIISLAWIAPLLLILSNSLEAQYLKVDTTQFIEWSDDLYLNWKDYRFRNRQNRSGNGMALTSVKHSIRGGIIGGEPKFQVKVLFVKNDSWTSDSTDIVLLAHEKLHFDIAEMFGRKIRKQIMELFKQGERDMSTYNKYVRILLGDFKRFSADYDKATDHGRNLDEQRKWFEIVFSELQRLKPYSKDL